MDSYFYYFFQAIQSEKKTGKVMKSKDAKNKKIVNVYMLVS